MPVRKKFLPSNPCAGVEFPVSIRGLYRPHYVPCPDYSRNVVRITTETGLRVDLGNAVVWIADSAGRASVSAYATRLRASGVAWSSRNTRR